MCGSAVGTLSNQFLLSSRVRRRYGIFNRSMLEIMKPLMMTWLFNSHLSMFVQS